jgi:hypothetical protein
LVEEDVCADEEVHERVEVMKAVEDRSSREAGRLGICSSFSPESRLPKPSGREGEKTQPASG